MTDLLRRAWDALDTFKQAYPENWHEEDEQVLKELMRADLKLSGVQRTWVGLTDEEIKDCFKITPDQHLPWHIYQRIEAKLKEKNT